MNKDKPKSIAQLAIQEGIKVDRKTGRILNPEKLEIPKRKKKRKSNP